MYSAYLMISANNNTVSFKELVRNTTKKLAHATLISAMGDKRHPIVKDGHNFFGFQAKK